MSLVRPPHALALGGTGVSSCAGPAPTPVASESLTQYQTLTGIGLNYSMVESRSGDNFDVSLPAGAVIVQATFWVVQDESTTTTAAVVTTATFNGTGVTAEQATTSFLWENLFYTNLRFDVTSLVTATGTSYSWSSNSVSSLGLPQAGYLAIVYQLASDSSVTTLVFADGMNVWHDNETTEDGPGPEAVGLDWSCASNPVCNADDISFSRAGGNIYDVDDGDIVDGKYADEIMDPLTDTALWRGPEGQLPVCGAEPCPQVSTYAPGSPAFSPGQETTMYDLYDNTDYASKDTVFISALVLMNKCPNPQSPTPTPNWTATPGPTPIPTSCGPPPSLYAPGTKEAAGLGTNSPFSLTVTGPSALPLNPLFLVRIYVGSSSYPAPAGLLSSVSYGGTPLNKWPAGINQIATLGNSPDTDFETWYLTGTGIPTGNQTLTLSWAGGSFKYPIEVVAEFFRDVDQATPLGAAGAGASQAGGSTYTSSLTTIEANSTVSSLLDDGESNAEYAGCEAVNSTGTTEFPTVLGSFDTNGAEAYGPANSEGATSILWALPTCTTFNWTSESVELIGAPCPPPTPTDTVTVTVTMSDTRTPSPSFSASPSVTATVTYSDTATASDTASDSPTATPTPSPSDTFSASPTRTISPTPTDTKTASPTRTITVPPTGGPSASPTATFTFSPADVPNASVTDTATPRPRPTDSPTASLIWTPSGTGTAAPTGSATETFTATRAATADPSPPATATASPTETATTSATSSASVTWTDTAGPSSTSSRTRTRTATSTATWTASAIPTPSTTMTQTFTKSATVLPSPYLVTVDIYNSAGELVRSLYKGGAANPGYQAQVLESLGPGGALQVDVTGLGGEAGTDLAWNATNNGGQAVAAGVYTVQIATTNSFGQVQTQTKMVSVMDSAGPVSLGIFNSAGELVANLSADTAGQSSEPVSMSLAPPGGQQGDGMVAVSGSSGGLSIKITYADGETKTVLWNGLGTQGQPLQPGNYVATLYQSEPGTGVVVKSQAFVLLDGPDASASGMAKSAMVVPNPVGTDWFTVQFQPDGKDSAAARLYTLHGSLAAEAIPNGPGSLRLSGNWSGGIFLLDFEVRSGPNGILARRLLKVAIVR